MFKVKDSGRKKLCVVKKCFCMAAVQTHNLSKKKATKSNERYFTSQTLTCMRCYHMTFLYAMMTLLKYTTKHIREWLKKHHEVKYLSCPPRSPHLNISKQATCAGQCVKQVLTSFSLQRTRGLCFWRLAQYPSAHSFKSEPWCSP